MEQNYGYYNEPEKKGNVITGLIGAIIGALIGAAAWAAVGALLEIITGLIGFLIGFLASKGYDLLKGRQGVAKLVCVIIAIVIGVVVGTAATYVWQVHNVYVSETAGMSALELRFVPTEAEVMKSVIQEPDVKSEMIKNLLLGLVFAVLGCIDLFKQIVAKPTAPAANVNAAAVPDLSAAQVPAATEEKIPTDTSAQ